MTDHADIVREALRIGDRNTDAWNAALAALDALVAERDEALADWDRADTGWKAAEARVTGLEAALTIEREDNPSRVICPKCMANLPCESCKRYSVLRDELEAEVARLREALMLYADDIPRKHNPSVARAALAKEDTDE